MRIRAKRVADFSIICEEVLELNKQPAGRKTLFNGLNDRKRLFARKISKRNAGNDEVGLFRLMRAKLRQKIFRRLGHDFHAVGVNPGRSQAGSGLHGLGSD